MSKIDTSSWKEFRIGDLFTSENGNTDIKKEHINGKGVDVVSSGIQGNGFIGKTDMEARIHNGHTITIDMFGNVFYRDEPYKMVTHARVFALVPNGFELDKKTGLFICTALNWLSSVYDYSNMCSFEKIKNLTILLPAKEEDVPDWGYMQERIAELEQERIAELEQYLVATGLNDYELTDEDIKTLSLSGFGHYEESDSEDAVRVRYEEFEVNDIADVGYGNKFDLNKMTQNCLSVNFVSRTATNNGVSSIVDKLPQKEPYAAGAITLALGGSIGSCFLQEHPFYTGQNVGVITLPECVSDKAKIYFTEALGKKCKMSFTAFGNEINKHLKTDLSVKLPIQTDTNGNPILDPDCHYHPDGYIPDWDFMEKYIKAIEKIVIADVVKWKDEEIAKTKEVVA